jgi:hypothetical protein
MFNQFKIVIKVIFLIYVFMTLLINDFNLNGTTLKVKFEIQFTLLLWVIVEFSVNLKLYSS